MIILECRNVSFSYGTKKIIDNVSFSLETACVTSAIGPNGAGKSTLLKLLAGYLRPSEGTILLDGRDIATYTPRERSRLVTTIPQTPSIPLDFTVEEYLMTLRNPFLSRLSPPSDYDRDIIAESLCAFDLDGFGNRHVSTLSGGELQRSVLAGALASHGKIILLDEPTASLDMRHALQCTEIFRKTNSAVFMITHDISLAMRDSDDFFVMKDGRIIANEITVSTLETAFSCPFEETLSPSGRRIISPI